MTCYFYSTLRSKQYNTAGLYESKINIITIEVQQTPCKFAELFAWEFEESCIKYN